MIKQISVFVQNVVGSLAEVTEVLKQYNINIRAFSVMDTKEFGILRLVVDQPELAEKVLRDNGFGFKVTHVIGVEIEDTPGSLSKVLKLLAEAGFFVNYLYSMVLRGQEAPLMVIHVEEDQRAEAYLKEKGIIVV